MLASWPSPPAWFGFFVLSINILNIALALVGLSLFAYQLLRWRGAGERARRPIFNIPIYLLAATILANVMTLIYLALFYYIDTETILFFLLAVLAAVLGIASWHSSKRVCAAHKD
jgi:hypothetical protein